MKRINISLKYNLCLLLVSITLFYVSCVRIHILPPEVIISTKSKPKANLNSKFSLMCLNILNTYSQMSPWSMEIYKQCSDNYQLLGANDTQIQIDRPFCFDSLNQFFCNYKIEPVSNNLNKCSNENLIQFVLNTIKGCVRENDNSAEKLNYKCPSLDYINYKIKNSAEFCSDSESKMMEASDFLGDDNPTYLYSTVGDKKTCRYLVDLYNTCIDADNLLFPNSNYQKCFYQKNAFFFCNKQERYTFEQYDLCSNYVLPTIAYKSLHQDISNFDKDFCNNFENTILKSHDELTANLYMRIEDKKKIIEEIEEILKKNLKLSFLSENLLKINIDLNKEWIEFYPEFSAIFKIRSNLTEVEYIQLSKLRKSFDQIFPYAANLNSMTTDQNFILSNFTDLFDSITAYYRKAEIYLDILSTTVKEFNVILSQNENITLIKQDGDFMLTQSIGQEEILAFQNEFIEIVQYIKTFMTSVMNRLKESNIQNNEKKINHEVDIKGIENYLKRLEIQKTNFYNLLLSE